jgi:hypothetical protein
METALSRAEQRAVDTHRESLKRQRGVEVEYDYALNDWMENHSSMWRARRCALALEKQREEINKHKWIMSEQACQDVGRDAVLDWISNYAAQWRDWFETQEFDEVQTGRSAGV